MDRGEIYADLYSEYESELRPLISKIEALSESVPADLFSIIAQMFDTFAHIADLKQKDNEEFVRKHLKKAQALREDAFIMCYKTLILIIDSRASKCLRGLSAHELGLLDFEFQQKLNDAKSSIRYARDLSDQTAASYKEAYEKYLTIEDFLNQLPKVEATSRNIVSSCWEKVLYSWIIPIITGLVFTFLIAVLYPSK